MSTDDQDDDKVAEALAAPQWPLVVPLNHPVDFGKRHVTELSFRRGKLGDLKGIKPDGVPSVDQLLLIASRMTGEPVQVLELLQDEDGSEVITIAMAFFARSLGAGKKR